ncbi:hypothetical protein JCM19294_359 [Nonlabens tegetincola]|uniref:Uncharacterized protein n=1 Tax=Nonlabens tegetincola TaxID=323273 RepID=A0A090Q484_9FLAO|nr:hypothetical protein JCM19294_359 [Nonlabens tegetincola]
MGFFIYMSLLHYLCLSSLSRKRNFKYITTYPFLQYVIKRLTIFTI